MYIIKKINQYDNNCVYFCDPIKNNIILESLFIKIFYSTSNVIFNGIYLELPFIECYYEKYYNKYKYIFNINNKINQEIISKIKTIEEDILNKYIISNKTYQNKVYQHIKCGNIKLFCDNKPVTSNKIILKISGLWVSSNNYGLTYKFVNLD